MAFRYSAKSRCKLATCHPILQDVFNEAIKYMDITIVHGRRGEQEQNELVRAGHSQLMYPKSWHNKVPYSRATDAVPCPIDWTDRERFTLYAGFIQGLAQGLYGVALVWGGDWNHDWKVRDNKFDDLAHFELPPNVGLHT